MPLVLLTVEVVAVDVAAVVVMIFAVLSLGRSGWVPKSLSVPLWGLEGGGVSG